MARVACVIAFLGFGLATAWEPEKCAELPEGVPCRTLYEHPMGSEFVGPCPVETYTSTDGCAAQFEGKSDADKCPQIDCPKALGVTFKLVCGGTCCPTCWAPDHVVELDRHTTVENKLVVSAAPQAPGTCSGVKCFKPICADGYVEGHQQGDCCYSCLPGR
mmetsp:Transcript_18483/g.41180  ORF Transcript_18483/g.41180 Transcript_18483/m.41180 type:complete len:161 (+) Transcript_18483:87-569(+)